VRTCVSVKNNLSAISTIASIYSCFTSNER